MAVDTFVSMVRPQLEQLRRMFPIGSNQHAFVPLPRSGPGTSAAPSQGASDAGTCAGEDPRRDAVVQVLRGRDPVDGPTRHIVLGTIPTMANWPPGLAIQLHVAGGDATTTWRYGAPAEGMHPSEPLHVRQHPDGRYTAAALPDQWIDCGAHADSLFEAVLVALGERDGVDHGAFTVAFMLRDEDWRTQDAELLRKRVGDAIAQGAALDAGAMQAPAPLPQPASIDDRVPQTSHRDAVVQLLRGRDALDRQTLEAALTAITTLPTWPAGVQIQLQVASAHSTTTMRMYGAADREPPLEPVHVEQSSDGRFAAAARGGTPPEQWIDCGAHADSLFEAVLEGLRRRGGVHYDVFTTACMLRVDDWSTSYAQLLRECVADAIVKGVASDAVVMQAPNPLLQFASSSNTVVTVRNKKRILGNNKVTADMVLRFSQMDDAGRQKVGSIKGFAGLNRVSSHALNSRVLVSGTLTELGKDLVQRATSGRLRVTGDLLARYRQAGIRTFLDRDQFAITHGVSLKAFRRYALSDGTLTPQGQEILQRDGSSVPTNPVTPELLQALRTMSHADFNSAGGLLGVALNGHYSYRTLRNHISGNRELTETGNDFVRRSTSGVPCNPVTPELILQFSQMTDADFECAGGLAGLAAKHHVSLPSLTHYLLTNGHLNPKGTTFVLRATVGS